MIRKFPAFWIRQLTNMEGIQKTNANTAASDIAAINEMTDEEFNLAIINFLSGCKTEDNNKAVGVPMNHNPVSLAASMKTPSEYHKCDICGKCFSALGFLLAHKTAAHSSKYLFKCEFCNRGFTQASSLSYHIRSHTGDKSLTCDICEKSFAHPTSLKRHRMNHAGEKPFKCDVCEKGFVQAADLKRHRLTHVKAEQLQCSICPSKFALASDLLKHYNVHLSEKPRDVHGNDYRTSTESPPNRSENFNLLYSTKGFPDQVGALLPKQESVIKERPCGDCGKRFSSIENLEMHRQIHTTKAEFKTPFYQCTVCRQTFKSKIIMEGHMMIIHRSALFAPKKV